MRVVVITAMLIVAAAAHAQEAPPDETATGPTTESAAVSRVADDAPGARAGKKKPKHKAAPDFQLGGWRGSIDAEGELVGGALSGRTTLREQGAIIEAGGTVEPAIERGRWRLAVPVRLAHRETPGATQRETRGGFDLDARYKTGPGFRLDLEAGLRFAQRPTWLDEYQPIAGGLGTTGRYSHLDLRLGAAIAAIPLRHQHVRAGLRYTDLAYDDDPTYDPIDAPTHLVPGDRREVDLDLSWRYFGDGWKLGGALAVEDQRDDDNFARDAGDGQTHAGAGGPPPNPLYHQLDVEPSVGAELELGRGDVEVGADLGYAVVSDRYQGYYSRSGLHPQVHAALTRGHLEAKLSVEALFARYGEGSYQSDGTPGRPALESGTRRSDRRLGSRLNARYRFARHLAAVVGLQVTRRDTNFPDYVPGVFPGSRAYDVAWDYTNGEITVGLSAAR